MSKPEQSPRQSTRLLSQKLSQRDLGLQMNRSLDNLAAPYQQPIRHKFPKDRTCRKQNSMTMLIETEQEEPRSSLRTNPLHNLSTVFQDYAEPVRARGIGMFHSLSFESNPGSVEKRSIQDLGVDRNRKRQYVLKEVRNDPILIGHIKQEIKPSRRPVQQAHRNYRDQGQRIKNYFVWQKTKQKGYLQRYRAAKNLK